jgi:hypothetical protein
MSSHFGLSTETLHRIVTGWVETAWHLQECPIDGLPAAKDAITGKAYESGVLLRFDPRMVDVPVSPVRLPADFWCRAIRNEHRA